MAINNTRYGAMSGKETLSIQVPTWHARLLKRWAYVRSRPKSTMATDIIQVGVEANEGQINRMYAEIAEIKGLTVEELDTQIGVAGSDDYLLDDEK